MAVNEIVIETSPAEVFSVLADPERYVEWVVGTAETEAVDREWPDEGAKLRFGTTEIELVLERVGDGTRLVMREEPLDGLVEGIHRRVTDEHESIVRDERSRQAFSVEPVGLEEAIRRALR